MGGTQSSSEAMPVKGVHVPSEIEPDSVLAYAYRVNTILDEEYPTIRKHITRDDILTMAEDLRDGVSEDEIRARLDEIVRIGKEAFIRGITSKVPSIPIPR